MNAINLELSIIHYINCEGDVVFEVYSKGASDPIHTSSVSMFELVKDLVDILCDDEGTITEVDAVEAAYQVVDEFQDCIDYMNDLIEDTEE